MICNFKNLVKFKSQQHTEWMFMIAIVLLDNFLAATKMGYLNIKIVFDRGWTKRSWSFLKHNSFTDEYTNTHYPDNLSRPRS